MNFQTNLKTNLDTYIPTVPTTQVKIVQRVNFEVIDWQRPWLSHLRESGLLIAKSADWIEAANDLAKLQALFNANAKSLSFNPQYGISDQLGYEAYIYKTGEIPTRDNFHDFFNALIWLRFPLIKQTLNHLQYKEIQRTQSLSNAEKKRGRQRDAATLFDENCAIVVSADASIHDRLKQRQWKQVLFHDREYFSQTCEVVLFGHALIEKLMSPYKAITSHVWNISVDSQWFTQSVDERMAFVDQYIAKQLSQGFVSTDFSHLPILGVPNWWHEQTEYFYEDAQVFRPARIVQRHK